jgi:hypothetical protein
MIAKCQTRRTLCCYGSSIDRGEQNVPTAVQVISEELICGTQFASPDAGGDAKTMYRHL